MKTLNLFLATFGILTATVSYADDSTHIISMQEGNIITFTPPSSAAYRLGKTQLKQAG